jgi:hypothetical protein
MLYTIVLLKKSTLTVGVDASSGQKVVYVHTKCLNILKKIYLCVFMFTQKVLQEKNIFYGLYKK